MRLAVLSDIHANEPALEAVLMDVAKRDPDEIWCLGDIVGYGAQPERCIDLVFEHCTVQLAGNHDLAVLDRIEMSSFSPAAGAAAEWTRDRISPERMRKLGKLEPSDAERDPAIYHASPRDAVWEYVLWPEQAGECMAVQAKRVALVGHSHVALCFTSEDSDDATPDAARGAQAPGGTELDVSAGRWLLNPGSVGQPRDGDPRAAWLELDTEEWIATYRRTPYEVDLAAEAIRAAGLPEHLARRLYVGQ